MDVSGMLNGMLPTMSYIINIFDRLFTIFCSYFGIDIDELYADSKEQEATEVPDATV